MIEQIAETQFQKINRGYNSVFQPDRLSIGLVVPIETYTNSPKPTMADHLERVQLAEQLGFSAVWLRDVPFNVPSFGDAGQLFDPFVYLGLLAGQTEKIALGVSSIILPLRHPAHVAKAAATADALSNGRLILGVASGDRPQEYPALKHTFEDRGMRFRESFDYIRQMNEEWPAFDNHYGRLDGTMDMLPKPAGSKIPLLVTGGSRQDPSWTAANSDGWMIYPRQPYMQGQIINDWRAKVETFGRVPQPVMQPLYIDLVADPNAEPQPIHLGMRLGTGYLLAYLEALQEVGINHVALNLRFNQVPIEKTMERLAKDILPNFGA